MLKRFFLLLVNEIRLARMIIPIHLVALLQPTLMYVLMALILVHPTFKMNILEPGTPQGRALLQAMQEVGSPIGAAYIDAIVVQDTDQTSGRQVIIVGEVEGTPTALQRYDLVDSNMVKNYRNRLTSAALLLWNESLDGRAVELEQHPMLPRDIPYTRFFGMAMLPLTAFLSAMLVGAVTVTQDFEIDTIREYRLSPVSAVLVLAARLLRLVLVGWLAACILLLAVAVLGGGFPHTAGMVFLILLPIAIIGGCAGMTVGLLLRHTIPAFVIGLGASFALWLLGSGFGLAAGFGGAYEQISRWVPNTFAVELMLPYFYGVQVGLPLRSVLLLSAWAILLVGVLLGVYLNKMKAQR